MSKTARVRLVSRPLLANFTRAQTVLACDVTMLYSAAATIAAGQPLTEAQVATINSVSDALALDEATQLSSAIPVSDRKRVAKSVEATADAAAVEQRRLLASTVVNTLRAENWIVTIVDGGYPDRYTGIEATRGAEHLVAAVRPGEMITDQASGHDGDETVEALAQGLREVGCAVSVDEGVPRDGGGGTLFSLRGGPTHAHAVQASLRHDPREVTAASHREAGPSVRLTAG